MDGHRRGIKARPMPYGTTRTEERAMPLGIVYTVGTLIVQTILILWPTSDKTNAGWFVKADKILHKTGRAGKWSHMPKIKRAMWRTGIFDFVVGSCVGLWLDFTLTLALLIITGLVLAVLGVFLTRNAVRNYRHHREWVRPLHHSLGGVLDVPSSHHPNTWLTIPKDFRTNDEAECRIKLPKDWVNTKESRNFVLQAARDKLGYNDAIEQFHMTGRQPYLSIKPLIPPPEDVYLKDVLEIIERLPNTQSLAGLGRKRTPTIIDLESDSPHVMINGASGGGKTVLARGIVTQGMHKGDITLILDPKRHSHSWAKGLPNVKICRSDQEIHDGLLWASKELERRNILVDAYADENGDLPLEVELGPRIWIVCEEQNAIIKKLRRLWEKIKPPSGSNISPAIDALNELLFMGRQVKMNIVGIAQMMTARTLGGPEGRENFGIRCMARYTVNAWKMLCPEVWPMPPMNRHKGRWQIVVGGEATETQVTNWSVKEARTYAMSGKVTVFPDFNVPASQGTPYLADQGKQAGTVPGPKLVGFRQAVNEGIVKCSLESLRSARKRDLEFPKDKDSHNGELLYSADELRMWERNREKSGVNISETV